MWAMKKEDDSMSHKAEAEMLASLWVNFFRSALKLEKKEKLFSPYHHSPPDTSYYFGLWCRPIISFATLFMMPKHIISYVNETKEFDPDSILPLIEVMMTGSVIEWG